MRARRLILTLTMMLSLMAAMFQTASAHSVYDRGFPYQTEGACTAVRSEISDGTGGGGYSRVDAESWFHDPVWNSWCNVQTYKTAYEMRAKYTLIKYNDATGNWDWCRNSDWFYNGNGGYSFMIQAWHGEYEPPCGHGYYGTSGGGYVLTNGQWNGGYVYGWQHYLP